MKSELLLIPVLLPLLAGCAMPLIAPLKKSRKALIAYTATALALTLLATIPVLLGGDMRLMLWEMSSTLTVLFKTDAVSRLFAALVAVMFPLAGAFAFGYMTHEHDEPRFYAFFLVVEAMLLALCFSGNLITMYLCYELVTLTSMPLVLHSLTPEAIKAGLKYLFYSIAGAFLALLGIFFFAQYGSTMEFTAGGVLDASRVAGHETALLVISFLSLLGFGAKAGLFPLHGWLPTAHPIAPAPASAVLSGVITKAGVLTSLRLIYYIIGAQTLAGTWVHTAYLSLILLTVFLGSMMAYKEPVLKKRLAYSSVSQLSYVLLGVALLSPNAFTGGLMHVVFHSVIKDSLFLCAGAFIFATGCTRVDELRGIGRQMPVTLWAYTLLSLALVGIPPFSGFVSKWFLATGSLASGVPTISWLAPVVLIISALLTAGYLLPLSIRGFFPGKDVDASGLVKHKISAWMWIPAVILAAACLLLGMFPQALSQMLETLSAALL